MRFFIAFILFIASIAVVVFWDRSLWEEIQALKEEKAAFESTIARVAELREIRDGLIQTYNSIPIQDIRRIKKMLPEKTNVGALSAELSNLTNESGLLLKNIGISFSADQDGSVSPDSEFYEGITLSLSISGPYNRFRNFLQKLEKSLRLIDITNISFSAGEKDSYDYSLTAKSYQQR